MAGKFKIGDLVWAKMKGFPAWPGRVIEPKPEVKRPAAKKNSNFVFFFGSENYAWIPEESTWLYATNKDKFKLNQRLPKGFKEAVEAIDDALKANPVKGEDSKKVGGKRVKKVDQIAAKLSGRPTGDNVFTALRDLNPGFDPHKKEPANGDKNERDMFEDDSDDDMPIKIPKVEDEAKTSKKNKDSHAKPTKRSIPTVAVPATKKQKMLDDSPRVNTAHVSPAKTPMKNPVLTSMTSPFKSSPMKPEDVFAGATPARDIIPTPAKIGFLGLGIMGQGMVLNLMKSGHEVTVWNRTAAKCRDFVKEGALKGNTPAEVVNQCDITFSCVSDPSALKDLVFGNCGVLQGITKNKGFVSMSTIDVETATDINEAVTARGGRFLESPVLGSKDTAFIGDLVILAAGDRTLYSDCFSCFQSIGKKTMFFGTGEVGVASKMKLISNLLMGTVLAGLSESMALAEKVGLDQAEMLQVIEWSSLACPLVSDKGQAILTSNYNQPSHSLKHLQKDLRLAVDMADAVDQALHVGAATNELFKKAKGKGYGENDVAAVYRAADM